jgi:membrane protein required for beta-lactamase induction
VEVTVLKISVVLVTVE